MAILAAPTFRRYELDEETSDSLSVSDGAAGCCCCAVMCLRMAAEMFRTLELLSFRPPRRPVSLALPGASTFYPSSWLVTGSSQERAGLLS